MPRQMESLRNKRYKLGSGQRDLALRSTFPTHNINLYKNTKNEDLVKSKVPAYYYLQFKIEILRKI